MRDTSRTAFLRRRIQATSLRPGGPHTAPRMRDVCFGAPSIPCDNGRNLLLARSSFVAAKGPTRASYGATLWGRVSYNLPKSRTSIEEDGGFWRGCARLVVFPASNEGWHGADGARDLRKRQGRG